MSSLCSGYRTSFPAFSLKEAASQPNAMPQVFHFKVVAKQKSQHERGGIARIGFLPYFRHKTKKARRAFDTPGAEENEVYVSAVSNEDYSISRATFAKTSSRSSRESAANGCSLA